MIKQFNTALLPGNGEDQKILRIMGNTQNMQKIFQAFKKYQLQLGKADDAPEILYIDNKINEFEEDLQTLKRQHANILQTK